MRWNSGAQWRLTGTTDGGPVVPGGVCTLCTKLTRKGPGNPKKCSRGKK